MTRPAARISDMHTCPMVTPPTPITPAVPHVGGPVLTGAPTVLICNMPAARISDTCVCIGPPDVITTGSPTVLTMGMPNARMGDSTVHGGAIATGAPTVLIGQSSNVGGGAPGLARQGQTGRPSALQALYHAAMELMSLPPTGSLPAPGTPMPEATSHGSGLSNQARQAEVLREAAEHGTPFCEACARATRELQRSRANEAARRRALAAEAARLEAEERLDLARSRAQDQQTPESERELAQLEVEAEIAEARANAADEIAGRPLERDPDVARARAAREMERVRREDQNR